MPNYAKMYAALCGHVSDVLDAIDNGAALEEVQFILNKALSDPSGHFPLKGKAFLWKKLSGRIEKERGSIYNRLDLFKQRGAA